MVDKQQSAWIVCANSLFVSLGISASRVLDVESRPYLLELEVGIKVGTIVLTQILKHPCAALSCLHSVVQITELDEGTLVGFQYIGIVLHAFIA